MTDYREKLIEAKDAVVADAAGASIYFAVEKVVGPWFARPVSPGGTSLAPRSQEGR